MLNMPDARAKIKGFSKLPIPSPTILQDFFK
jgi:hypothetical protein